MENKPVKKCPFRVCKIEHPPMLRGSGTIFTDEFYDCIGEACAAYYPGGCLRLGPAAITLNTTDYGPEEWRKLGDMLNEGHIMACPAEESSVEIIPAWIPVTDHLPDEDLPLGVETKLVQVLLSNGTVTVGYCNRGNELWFYLPFPYKHFVGHGYDLTPVVAWQPMAVPPKEVP